MSVTTSSNVVSQKVLHVLTDYDIHHSGSSEQHVPVALANSRADLSIESSNPPGWPTAYRRVPPYRPIDRNLDMNLRPAGTNFIGYMFITTMLGGVTLNANAAALWAATGGRLNKNLFRYKIGGEW